MEISVDITTYEQKFRTTIAGVTKRNSDGTDRQTLLKVLRSGEELKLVREPENPYDKYAIAIFRVTGEQLGYVPAGDRRLADHIDSGGPVSAKVVNVTGGSGVLGFIFKSLRRSYGCVIEIVKGDFNWKEIAPYMEQSRKIEEHLKATHDLESIDPTKAISQYRKAIDDIVALDKAGPIAASWRRARYPINRLSLLLEKSCDFQGALKAILEYEQFNDRYGLTSTEEKSVVARKQRISKKLGASDTVGT
jgi:hypothetical protein